VSRSGYSDDEERYPGQYALHDQRVRNAIRGERGQEFLRELVAALDAMPVKSLAAYTVAHEGEFCALGCVGGARGLDLSPVSGPDMGEWWDWSTEWLRDKLGLSDTLAREVVYRNDDAGPRDETGEARWQRVRSWAASHITGGGA
jgi:hypothetical protein